VFTEDYNFLSPDEFDETWELGEQKALVNVGSVGQPRDGNPRASYVILDEKTVRFRRIDYDFEQTIAKIYPIPDLDNFLGDRLREGR
jgi:diadenosine tetraphosphatase ApaH/serine/threonine PP2A family protein phosphatase